MSFTERSPETHMRISIASQSDKPLTWSKYSAFRKSLCRPFPGPVNYGGEPKPTPDQLDYLNQAIHELSGECAEVGEIIQKSQLGIFDLITRNEIVDELGDVLFCCDWVLGILDANWTGIGDDDDNTLEVISVTDPNVLAHTHCAHKIFTNTYTLDDKPSLMYCMSEIYTSAFDIMVLTGLLSNSYKKLVYRIGKKYNVTIQAGRVGIIIAHVNMILFLLGFSVKECLERNIKKLIERHNNKPSIIVGLVRE